MEIPDVWKPDEGGEHDGSRKTEEEDMERHTVEYTFEGEKLSFVAGEHADLTLYRTDRDTYFVYLDARKVGGGAVLEVGENPRGFSEHDIRDLWPELLEAQSRQ
jgi:hypothetical protein